MFSSQALWSLSSLWTVLVTCFCYKTPTSRICFEVKSKPKGTSYHYYHPYIYFTHLYAYKRMQATRNTENKPMIWGSSWKKNLANPLSSPIPTPSAQSWAAQSCDLSLEKRLRSKPQRRRPRAKRECGRWRRAAWFWVAQSPAFVVYPTAFKIFRW